MNATHLHLILNHLPVLGTLFGVLLLSAGLWRKSDDLKKAGLVAFILSALAIIPVFLTGEPAESRVEHFPGVSEALISAHETVAKISLILMELLGVVSLGILFLLRRGHQRAPSAMSGVMALSLLAGGFMIYTAGLGGQIRHSEIRGVVQAGGEGEQTTSPQSAVEHEREHEDD